MEEYPALERELGLLMRRGASLGREIAAQMHPDLDSVSYSTLARIAEAEPARAADLAEYFGIHKAVVSRQLSELERLALVERTSDPADGRARLLRLTILGKKRMQEVRDARDARFRALVQCWPKSDVDELARLLGELNRVLETGERLHPLAPPRSASLGLLGQQLHQLGSACEASLARTAPARVQWSFRLAGDPRLIADRDELGHAQAAP